MGTNRLSAPCFLLTGLPSGYFYAAPGSFILCHVAFTVAAAAGCAV